MDKEFKKLNENITKTLDTLTKNNVDSKTINDKLTRIENNLVRIETKIKRIESKIKK